MELEIDLRLQFLMVKWPEPGRVFVLELRLFDSSPAPLDGKSDLLRPLAQVSKICPCSTLVVSPLADDGEWWGYLWVGGRLTRNANDDLNRGRFPSSAGLSNG